MSVDFSKRTKVPWRVVQNNGFENEVAGNDGKGIAGYRFGTVFATILWR